MKILTKVIDKKYINNEIVVLRLQRNQFRFKAGQYIVISFPNEKEAREYSIYSGENDPYIDILIKTVPAGSFSKRLGALNIGADLEIDGPYGFFVLKENEVQQKKHLFVATGTGISPFKSYIASFPNLKYQLLHGIGMLNERIEPDNFSPDSLIYCVSRELSKHYNGRVTNYLSDHNIDKEAIYHLCGNSEMINDVSDILEENGILPENIRTEVFY